MSETRDKKFKVLGEFHTLMGTSEETDDRTYLQLLDREPMLSPKTKQSFDKLKITYNANGTINKIESKRKVFVFVWTFDKRLAEIDVTLKSLEDK